MSIIYAFTFMLMLLGFVMLPTPVAVPAGQQNANTVAVNMMYYAQAAKAYQYQHPTFVGTATDAQLGFTGGFVNMGWTNSISNSDSYVYTLNVAGLRVTQLQDALAKLSWQNPSVGVNHGQVLKSNSGSLPIVLPNYIPENSPVVYWRVSGAAS